jgi:hypothetical protein
MLQPVTGIFMAGMLAISSSSAIGEKVILRQGFEKFDENSIGTVGLEFDKDAGSWRDFGKSEGSPKVTIKEFHTTNKATKGKSVAIIRGTEVGTTDFWLMGQWSPDIDKGKIRISFSTLRDTDQSGFGIYLGNKEKFLGSNTIALGVSNVTSYGDKLTIMDQKGAWEAVPLLVLVGTWTRIVLEVDFIAKTYTVSVAGVGLGRAIPFESKTPICQISFIPGHPPGNLSYIDDVEIISLD